MAVARIVSIQAYRTLKECRFLFRNYAAQLKSMDKYRLLSELNNYYEESKKYPAHLLTIAKGEVLTAVLRERSLTQELCEYAREERKRLRTKIEQRIYVY